MRVMGNFQLVNEQVYCCKGLCFNQNHELRGGCRSRGRVSDFSSQKAGGSIPGFSILYVEDANPKLLSVFTGV